MTSYARITQRSVATSSLEGLQGNLTRLSKLQQQLSSGRIINRPSDDPTGTVAAMQYRSDIRAAEQHGRNAEDGLGWVTTIDSTMMGMLDSVRRSRDLTVQGLNTGAGSPQSRVALAVEIEGIRDGLVQQANTTHLGRPVFGGATGGARAYAENGTYLGTPAPAPGSLIAPAVVRTVGDGALVRVDLSGPEVFQVGAGPDTKTLFGVLDSIATALRDPALPAEDLGDALGDLLGSLDEVREQMQTGLSEIGSRTQRIEAAKQLASDRVISLRGQLAETESTDVPKAIVELQMAEMSYQAALGATSRALQPSLLDWLR